MTKPHLTIYIRVKITLILIIAVVFASFSQNSIGIGTVTPHQSAILDVYSTHKGFLPPRMSATEMDVINSPTEGLMIYCSDCTPKGIYVRSGNEFKMLQFFENPVEYLNIDDVSITRGTTSFNISPTLIPNEATVDYELIRNPIEVTMEGTRINISPDLAIGVYNITVKATGKDNYNGKTGATFKLNITRIPLTGLSVADVSIIRGNPNPFVMSLALTPSEATVVYSLIDPPTGIYISETTINISANMSFGIYDITLKAKGNGNYTGETETAFRLRIIPNDDFVIVFNDANFETAVKRNLGIVFYENVKYRDVKDVIELDVSSQGITNIEKITNMEEIRYFTVLESLECYNNQLRSLDLSQNTVLKELYCSKNQLTSLDLRQNTDLIFLKCIENQLRSLDLSQNTVLKELYCSNNQLPSLDLRQNTDLEVLNCRDNQLPSLDLRQNTVLEVLNCSNNQLPSLDLRQNTVLEELDCSNNQLTSLDLRQNTDLEVLNCRDNQLPSLDLRQNTVLEVLNCSNNQLPSLDLRQNTVLEELDCSNNQLTSLDLSQNTVLNVLYCSNNQLTSLDLSQNTVLNVLYCQNNQLTSLDIRGMRRVDEGLTFNNTTLQTLKVHQSIKDHQSIITLKRARGNNVTISTYSASPGSTTYNPICNNYNPRGGGGTCND